ncbi:short coiled-coil protein B-like [Clytia hemisphaerica]|uniref:Short coiled-coil protein n=1 Tax=Clytia hemisphaerica TaxID=252671 RepID=A0A7M5VAG3_9CNID
MATTDNMVNIPLSSDEDTGNRGSGAGSVERRTHNIQQKQPPLNKEHNIQIDQTDDFSDAMDGDEKEEKSRLIQQVFSLQNTLDDLSQRVDAVKDENTKLKSENQILGQYIENLMAASSVFQGNKMKNKNDKSKKDGKK